jgi:hypothetical protein
MPKSKYHGHSPPERFIRIFEISFNNLQTSDANHINSNYIPISVPEEFLEEGEMFEDEEKFWEEMNGIKKKIAEEEEGKRKEEKIMEEKMEVEEKKQGVKEKEKSKKQGMSLYNKYKRKREGEDNEEYNIYKKRSVPGYFQYACEQLANDEKNLYNIFKEFPSIITRHYKSLERIVYERDRLKKRLVLEVSWICGPLNKGEIQWVDNNIDSYEEIYKVGNFFLDLTGDKNVVYNPLLTNEKYSDLIQMCTDNHMELKVKYGYYNFFPEKLIIISHVHPREWCSKCRSRVDDCSELMKRISRIIECSLDYKTNTSIYTDCQ